MLAVRWPEKAMTVCGGVPPRIRCRTPLRRRSCTMRPVRPSAPQALVQGFRESRIRRPLRWNALLRREMPVAGGSLDHLLVDQHGVLTLIETKLAEFPAARREVVGQILDYAANAEREWGNGEARRLAQDYWERRQ